MKRKRPTKLIYLRNGYFFLKKGEHQIIDWYGDQPMVVDSTGVKLRLVNKQHYIFLK